MVEECEGREGMTDEAEGRKCSGGDERQRTWKKEFKGKTCRLKSCRPDKVPARKAPKTTLQNCYLRCANEHEFGS